MIQSMCLMFNLVMYITHSFTTKCHSHICILYASFNCLGYDPLMLFLQWEMSYLGVIWQRWSIIDKEIAYKTAIKRHIVIFSVYHQSMVSCVIVAVGHIPVYSETWESSLFMNDLVGFNLTCYTLALGSSWFSATG